MGAYLAAVWRCRYFWLSLVKTDLRSRYRGSVLGMGWSLVHPIAMTTILCTVFHTIFHINVGEYAPFLLVGLAGWNYVVATTRNGCQCFFHGEGYIRQYPAPLLIYPLRTALCESIHFLPALLVAIGLVWFYQGFGNLPCLFSLVPAVLLTFVFVWSLALLAGFANVYFQDTTHLTEVGFQFLFYATPVMYKPDILQNNGLGWLVRWNPLVALLDLFRQPIIENHVPSLHTFAVVAAAVLLTTVAAVSTLVTLQRRLIFQL